MDKKRYWLHVPLETTRGDWLQPPPDEKISVLGHSAKLHSRDLPNMNSLTNAGTSIIRQWLLFDPIADHDARNILTLLREKIPVLSLRQKAALRVAASELSVSPHAIYNGPIPTLIPEHLTPNPAWADLEISSYLEAKPLFENILEQCPPVSDERILAAIHLEVASRYDVLPRSVFLALLTILDSLAERTERPESVQAWLTEKASEAAKFDDPGLRSSLANLKQASHGAAVRGLVERACRAMGYDETSVKKHTSLATTLYQIRSSLSHAGTSGQNLDVEGARTLVSLVLNSAIDDPTILKA
ncbi:MAG: hypothetical protein RLW87_08495 [Alphaproteobacteria bacterium]